MPQDEVLLQLYKLIPGIRTSRPSLITSSKHRRNRVLCGCAAGLILGLFAAGPQLYALEVLIKPGYTMSHYDVEFIDETLHQTSYSLQAAVEKAYNRKTAAQISYQVLIGENSNELSRHIYGLGGLYCLYGDVRLRPLNFRSASFRQRGRWAVFVPGSVTYNMYQVRLKNRPGKLKGNIIQLLSGIGLRLDLSSAASLVAEWTTTVFSLADGNGRTTASDHSISLGTQWSF